MLSITIFSVIALALGLIAIASTMLVAGVATHAAGRFFQFLMLLTTFTSIVNVLLSGRIMRTDQWGLVVESDALSSDGLLAKLLLILTIGVAVAMCLARLTHHWNGPKPSVRFRLRGLRHPSNLIWAFFLYYIAFSIFPIFLGQGIYFHPKLIYPFFVFLALFLWLQASTVDPVIVVKQCLGIVVFSSLLAALAIPSLSLQPGYTGFLPFFGYRLYGLTAHANTLGAVASVLLVLEFAEPSRRRWLFYSVFLATALALVLSQSKTAIFAASVGLAIAYSWRIARRSMGLYAAKQKTHDLAVIPFIALFLVFVLIVCIMVMFSDLSVFSGISSKLDPRLVSDAATAAGRTLIWDRAIQAGMENPLFGQGADYWNADTRARYGLSAAFHAHNLFLQAFSLAGFVGLGALLYLLFWLARYSIRAAGATNGGSIALLAVFSIRSIFEVPLQVNSVLGAEFFAIMAFLVYAMDRGSAPITLADSTAPGALPPTQKRLLTTK